MNETAAKHGSHVALRTGRCDEIDLTYFVQHEWPVLRRLARRQLQYDVDDVVTIRFVPSFLALRDFAASQRSMSIFMGLCITRRRPNDEGALGEIAS